VLGEIRTMPQLRADVFGDLLTGVSASGPVAVQVGVLIPMLTLLGQSEMPASLEGYGPTDGETARTMAAGANSIYRILTDPVTGAILDIDLPTKYIPEVFGGCGN
jgi:hypothetical protein